MSKKQLNILPEQTGNVSVQSTAVATYRSVPKSKHQTVLTLGRSRHTKFYWVGKHVNTITKPSNSPTQAQPNPRKIRLKVAFWATFSHSKHFFGGLGLVLYRKQTARNLSQPNFRKHPINTINSAGIIIQTYVFLVTSKLYTYTGTEWMPCTFFYVPR